MSYPLEVGTRCYGTGIGIECLDDYGTVSCYSPGCYGKGIVIECLDELPLHSLSCDGTDIRIQCFG